MNAKSIVSVTIAPDRSAFAIKLLDDQNNEVNILLPATELHILARGLQSVAQYVPDDKPPPTGTAKSFPITQYAVGHAFPDSLSLVLYTLAFGRMGFAMDPTSAEAISADLKAHTARLQAGQSNLHH